MPIPETARSNTWFYGSSIIGTAGSNSVGGTDASPVVSVVCVSETGRSLVQRSPIECGVSECDRGRS
jgi:hypothetical protein